jgi:hypothetical protein
MNAGQMVPYFEAPRVVNLEEMMAFDRTIAEAYPTFIRSAFQFEALDSGAKITSSTCMLVISIRPGIRIKRTLNFAWGVPKDGFNVFVPDSAFVIEGRDFKPTPSRKSVDRSVN